MTLADMPVDSSPIPDGATCRGCGYALRGLSAGRCCPECGRAFDPDDRSSFRLLGDGGFAQAWATFLRIRRDHLNRLPYGAETILLAAMALTLNAVEAARHDATIATPYALALWVLVLCRWVVGTLAPRDRRRPPGWRATTLAIAVAAILFTGRPVYWECPHGRMVMLGPVGVAHSTTGGPCRNFVTGRRRWHLGGAWYAVLNPNWPGR